MLTDIYLNLFLGSNNRLFVVHNQLASEPNQVGNKKSMDHFLFLSSFGL